MKSSAYSVWTTPSRARRRAAVWLMPMPDRSQGSGQASAPGRKNPPRTWHSYGVLLTQLPSGRQQYAGPCADAGRARAKRTTRETASATGGAALQSGARMDKRIWNLPREGGAGGRDRAARGAPHRSAVYPQPTGQASCLRRLPVVLWKLSLSLVLATAGEPKWVVQHRPCNSCAQLGL